MRMDIGALQRRYGEAADPKAELRAVVAEVHARIAEVGDPGIFITLRPESDLAAEAAALPDFDPVANPLWGIPFAVKDNIDVAGLPTTAACRTFHRHPAEDAFVVARLRAAGALVVGKTNLDQFATGLVGTRTPWPVPRNALDPALVPGGSSSGSAVAVAQGIVSFALGTDTAGSGRVPAAMNGIVGIKPTLGLLSASGVVPACRTLDTISVFARTVPQAWRVLEVCAGHDPHDAYSRTLPPPRLSIPSAPVIGVPDDPSRIFFGDAAQATAFDAALARLAGLGARLVPIDLTPFFRTADLLYHGPWLAERQAALEALMPDGPGGLHPVTAGIVAAAGSLSAADAFRGLYRLADLRRDTDRVLSGLDLVCVPTIPRPVSLAEIAEDPIGPNTRLGTYTNFVNLLDLCGIALPTAAADGPPAGSVTLLARAGQDGLAAGLAMRLEAGPGGLPDPKSDNPAAGETVIAAVGAHMSGLPLNGELTRLGARCLGPARTAAAYRLFALAGGSVPKPGLLRVGRGGVGIDVELWAIAEERVGAFMAGIPAPLSIGSLDLADGTRCKGFLVEHAAIDAAPDISSFGGWRRYLAHRAALAPDPAI